MRLILILTTLLAFQSAAASEFDEMKALDAALIDTMHISNFGYKRRPDNYSSAGRGAGP